MRILMRGWLEKTASRIRHMSSGLGRSWESAKRFGRHVRLIEQPVPGVRLVEPPGFEPEDIRLPGFHWVSTSLFSMPVHTRHFTLFQAVSAGGYHGVILEC